MNVKMTAAPTLLVVVLAVLLAACEKATSADPSRLVDQTIDGVRIVENSTLSADSTSWTFDSVPHVVIGAADGDPRYIIGRLAGYVRRPDGTVLIADGIAQTVRAYDSAGVFLRQYGRAGDGPGEYRVLANIVAAQSDSMFVVDYEGRRVNVLDPQLEFVRSFRIRLQDGRPESVVTSDGIADVSGEGYLLMYDFLNVCGRARGDGFCEDSMQLFVTDLTGIPVGELGRFVYDRHESRRVSPGRSVSWGEPHPQVFRRIKGNRVYYADAKRFEIRVYDLKGKLDLIVRAPYSAQKYGRSDFWPRRMMQQEDDPRRAEMMRVLEDAQRTTAIPDSLPQFSGFLVDEAGNMWVNEYLPPGRHPIRMPKWFVFSPEGKLTHTVRAPYALRTFNAPWLRSYPQIGDDYAVTDRVDADGVSSVVMYRLRKQ